MAMAITTTTNAPQSRRFQPGRVLLNLVGALMDLFLLLVIVFLVARLILNDFTDLIGLGNSVLHLVLLAAVVCLPLALLMRRWHTAILAAVPTAVFAGSYGAMLLPRTIDVPADAPRLTLMTYNLHSEYERLDPIIAVIREANPDIIAFQELSKSMADRLTVEFADVYPEMAFHAVPDMPVIGQGLMSRYPIIADEYWRNDALALTMAHQRALLDINGETMTLYNTHPVHPLMRGNGRMINVQLRSDEITALLDRADQDDGTVILMGDFNMSDQSDDYRRVSADYHDVFRAAGQGLGWTFPDLNAPNANGSILNKLHLQPIVRLDYLFYRGDLQPVSARVWPTAGGSDHRPVFAELAMSDGT